MIDLYTARTPNGRKISIMLEECGARYETRLVDLEAGEQFDAAFLRINPNGKIPAIVHHAAAGSVVVFESAAILIYLAEAFDRLLPRAPAARAACLSWTVWQVANVGPMFGQAHHFATLAAERSPYAIERFSREAARLIAVMEDRLRDEEFLAGHYSIADIAVFPWIRAALDPMTAARPELIGAVPSIRRWFATVGARDAVQRGIAFGQ